MKVDVEKIEKSQAVLTVEVEVEHVEKAVKEAYGKLSKKVNIPGFRKGKAPKSLLERHINKFAMLEEAADIMIPSNYMEAVNESGVEPVARPSIEVTQLEENKPFIFKATVDIKPEVTLGEYKGLEIEKKDSTVTDEDVQKDLESMQQRHSKLIDIKDEEIQKEDIALIAFEGFVDGEAFEGGKSEGYSLEVGSGTFIPGFEDQIIGAKVNDKLDVKVTFPESYHKEDLAGKEALFKVEIKGIKRREINPLDDEFAKDVSEFETLEELKSDIKNKLEESAKNEGESYIREQAIAKAVEGCTVDIPGAMIENKAQSMIEDLGQRLQMQGLSLEQYLQYTNSDVEKLKEQYLPQAEQSVKTDLVLEAIANKEEIKATEDDVDKEIEKIAEQHKQKVEVVKATLLGSGRTEMLQYGIAMDKTVDFLVENSNIA